MKAISADVDNAQWEQAGGIAKALTIRPSAKQNFKQLKGVMRSWMSMFETAADWGAAKEKEEAANEQENENLDKDAAEQDGDDEAIRKKAALKKS